MQRRVEQHVAAANKCNIKAVCSQKQNEAWVANVPREKQNKSEERQGGACAPRLDITMHVVVAMKVCDANRSLVSDPAPLRSVDPHRQSQFLCEEQLMQRTFHQF